jgi:hypothetical protein
MAHGLFETELIRRGPWRTVEYVEAATLHWVDWFSDRLLEVDGARDCPDLLITNNRRRRRTTTAPSLAASDRSEFLFFIPGRDHPNHASFAVLVSW